MNMRWSLLQLLLNYENKSLQYIPIRVIYKSDINK